MNIMRSIREFFSTRAPSPADRAFTHAMAESDRLITRMRECSEDSRNPIRSLMADIWSQNHNIPYITTVYESVQEMNAAVAYKANGAGDPKGKD